MLRTFYLSSAIALSVLFGTSTGFIPSLQAASTEATSWQKFDSQAGKFRVLMPKAPEVRKQSFPMQGTKLTIQMHTFTALDDQRSHQAAYSVAYADFPFIPTTAEAAEVLLDASQSQILLNNTLLARSSLQLKGNPGRELKLKDPKGLLTRARMFLVKERIYMVMVFSHSEQGLASNSDRFLNSFELADK